MAPAFRHPARHIMSARQRSLWRHLVLALLAFPALLMAGSFLSVVLVDAATAAEGTRFAHAILRKGPDTVARRVLTMLLILVVPLALRRSSWKGLRDLGLTRYPDPPDTPATPPLRPVAAHLGGGLLLGLVSLGAVIGLSALTGTRIWRPEAPPSQILALLPRLVSEALAVALFEELAVRGVLFRVWARHAGFWVPALALSIGFALVHHVSPTVEAFNGSHFGTRVGQVFATTLRSLIPPPEGLIPSLNLCLMSLVLCAMVRRHETIWLAAGAHAGWVLAKRLNSRLFDSATVPIWSTVAGERSDALDALGATLVLGVLLKGFLRSKAVTKDAA